MPSTLNQTPQESTKSKIKKIDFLGILSFTAIILLLLFLLQSTDFSTIEQSPLFYLLGGLFVGVASAFLLIEMFWAEIPLIPVDMIQKACGGILSCAGVSYCWAEFCKTSFTFIV